MNVKRVVSCMAAFVVVVTVTAWAVQAGADKDSAGICAKHQVAEAACPFCRPDLIEQMGFCGGHGVPEALCTRCRPGLVKAFKAEGDWCAGHDLPESQCVACNPGLEAASTPKASAVSPDAQATSDRLWCKAHDVYEDECVLCHPELKDKTRRANINELYCGEHDVMEKECGICQPQLAQNLKPGDSLKIRQVSRVSATKAGIETARPRYDRTSRHLIAFAQVRYNQNRSARITPLAAGVVHRVYADVGQVVAKDEVLAEIVSSEAAAAKRDYLVAIVDERVKSLAYQREKELSVKQIAAQQSLQKAQAEHEMAGIVTMTARQKLINYGFTDAEVDQVKATRSSSSRVAVRAPYAGVLVKRSAVVGEAVQPGTGLFTLVDLSTMWLELAVPESEIDGVAVGDVVEAAFRSLPGVTIDGELIWVSSSVDERTRLVNARARVRNADGRLRDGMFGEVSVLHDEARPALRVPFEAVQRLEGQPYVFVKMEEDLFALRRVVTANRVAGFVEVLQGIRQDEEVVVTGAFTMKSEFLKSRLGAGCVDH